MSQRWLVISHEASNTGAPRMLLKVLRGIREIRGPAWSCEIILCRGGPLQPEFDEVGTVHSLSHAWGTGGSLGHRLFRRFINRPWIHPRRLADWVRHHEAAQFDLIYNNTATNGRVLSAVRHAGRPVVTHVHELADTLRRLVPLPDVRQTLEYTDHFLAVSPPVAEDLVELGARPDRITVTSNFLTTLPPAVDATARAARRRELGLPMDAAVVTGCGYLHPIKGPDVFVEVADALTRLTQRPVLFNWIGGVSDAAFARRVRALVRQRRLESVVRFLGPMKNPSAWFGASDLVLVTSRMESFPLVALEAAALGRAVVAFAGARGLNELLAETPELLIAEFEPRAMARVMNELLVAPSRADALGRRLRAKVAAAYVGPARIQAILDVIDRVRHAASP